MARTPEEAVFAPDPFGDDVPFDLDFNIREHSVLLGMDVDEFVTRWTETTLDPLNAGRLLALNGISSAVDRTTQRRIMDINGDHDSDPIHRRIVAPALRVRGDFVDHSDVMVQAGGGSHWHRHGIFCVKQSGKREEAIVPAPPQAGSSELSTIPRDHMWIGFDPKSPRVFTTDDYAILQRTEADGVKLRRKKGEGQALRNSMLLSHFDNDVEEDTLRQVLRHFELLLRDTYPRTVSE